MTFFENNRNRFRLFIGAFIVSFSAVYVEMSSIGPDTFGLYRNFFAIIFLIPFIIYHRENPFKNKGFIYFVLAGIFLFVDFYFWNRAIKYLGPGMATLLGNFQVFFLGGLSYLFFKDRLSVKYFISIVIAIFGLFLLTGASQIDFNTELGLGVVYGLLTAVMYAGFLICLKKGQLKETKSSALNNLFIIYFVTTICFCILLSIHNYTIIKLIPFLGCFSFLKVTYNNFYLMDMQNIFAVVLSALFSSVIGWILISGALPKVKIAIAGLMLLLQPVFSYLWDILFFGKVVNSKEIFGAFIALIAIYIGSYRKKV